MIKNKKSQIAMEFLMTYGWIKLIVIGVIAVLANYGFLNPSRYLPERVEFTEQLKCEEYFLDTNADGENLAALILRNNFGRPITIHELYIKTDTNKNCSIKPVEDIDVGKTAIIACTKNLDLNKNVKNDINFIIVFSRNVTGAPTHNVSGLIFAEAVEGEYCNQLNAIGGKIHCEDNVKNCRETDIDCSIPAGCGDCGP